MDLYDIDVDVHGGFTYSAKCDGDPDKGICHVTDGDDDVTWFGFDCAHDGDESHFASGHDTYLFRGEYRDIGYVRREVERLAKQAELAHRTR